MKTIGVMYGVTLVLCSSVWADTYYFDNISGNNAANAAAGESQLRMEVTPVGATHVNFRFFWEGATPMSITAVFFDDDGNDDGVLGTSVSLGEPAGVSFHEPAGPPGPGTNFPAGNTVDFIQSPDTSASADPPPSSSGVNVAWDGTSGEYLDFTVDLFGGNTFANVISALNQGYLGPTDRGLRVGMHVQAIGTTGGSESFVNVVPLPPAAWAGLASLGGVCGLGYIRRRSFRA